MKTVSTKLDKQDFEKFQEMCNYEGKSPSTSIRELIQIGINAYEEGLEVEKELKELRELIKGKTDSKTPTSSK